MIRIASVLVLIGSLMAPAVAQEAEERDPLRSIGRRLQAELSLTSEQKAVFDRLLQEEQRALRGRSKDAIAKVLRDAAQASRKGASIEKFQAELSELTLPPQLNLVDQLAPHLNDQQSAKIDAIRKRYDPAKTLVPSGVLDALAAGRVDLRLDEQGEAYDRIAIGIITDITPGVRTKELSQEQLDEVLKALQEAMEAGDEDAIRGVRGKVLAEQKNSRDVLLNTVFEINAILSDVQRPALVDLVGQLSTPRVIQRDGTAPRVMARAARRCQLTSEQSSKLKRIERNLNPNARGKPNTLAELVYVTRTQIEAILNEQQVKAFRRALSPQEESRRPGREGKAAGKAGKPTEP